MMKSCQISSNSEYVVKNKGVVETDLPNYLQTAVKSHIKDDIYYLYTKATDKSRYAIPIETKQGSDPKSPLSPQAYQPYMLVQ
jgi:hypothetical protein